MNGVLCVFWSCLNFFKPADTNDVLKKNRIFDTVKYVETVIFTWEKDRGTEDRCLKKILSEMRNGQRKKQPC